MLGESVQLRIRPGVEPSYSLDIYHPCKDPDEPHPLPITREGNSARNQLIRQRVSQLVRPLSTRLDLTESEKEELLLELSQQGALAFEEMFPEDSEARSEIVQLLQNPEITTIKVYAKQFSVPWEILSAKFPYLSASGWQREKMWGERFIIQRFIPLGRRQDRRRQPAIPVIRPKISLAAYRRLSYVPDEIRYLDQLKANNEIDLAMLRPLNRRQKNNEMQVMNHFYRETTNIAHFACHLRPHASAGGSSLRICDNFDFTPDDVRIHSIRFNGNPLVVLNACESGISHPLQEEGFVSTFLEYSGSLGLIATDCEVPSIFATAFAKHFYRSFVLSGQPLGPALMATRQSLIRDHNNPLALLYGLYQADPDTFFMRVTALDRKEPLQ